jgi:transcription initiation factor TFIIE subunit alpha
MKITNVMIEEVIMELIGEDALPLVDFLKDNKNVSEFQISTKTKIPVDKIRNQLYRLYNHNIVSFIRKKDKEKGWYIYYWTLNKDRIKFLTTDIKIKKVEKLKERLERENGSHFFACQYKCIRIDFEQATNFEYKCPECGELLMQEDNSEQILKIKEQIKNIEKQIEKEKTAKEKALSESVAKIEKEELKNKKEKTKKTKKKIKK